MLAAPVACHYCGEVGLKRVRDYQRGFTELACSACRNKHESIRTCAGCRRNRPVYGERDGHPFCGHCYPQGAPPIITCKTCRKRKFRFNKAECEDCAWERSHQLLVGKLAAEFQTPWAAGLFEKYHSEAKLKTLRGHWRKSLTRDVDFFRQLEVAFDSAESLNGVLIVRRLGNDFVMRYRRAMSFLAHMGLIVMDDDPDYLVERAISRIQHLTEDPTEWIAQVLRRFLIHMLNARARIPNRERPTRVPTKSKSLESAIRAGHRLLNFAHTRHGAAGIRDLSQEILDLHLAKKAADRTAASAFIRYVNAHERTFHKLKMRRGTIIMVAAHRVYPEKTRKQYLRTFAAVTERKQLHWALACLLNLLYAQQIDRLVKLTLDRVRESEFGYEIRFAKEWLLLDPLVQPLMQRWMTVRREFGAFDATGSSDYVFPGQRSGTHLTATSSKNFRVKHDYDARNGRITALAALIRGGIKQSRILTDCFGISGIRAHQFLVHFGAYQHDEARYARHAYGH